MCFQAIAEIMGSAVGIFLITIIVVFMLMFAGILIFDLVMLFLSIFIWLLFNPIVWVVIILLVVSFFVLIK